MSAEAIDVLIRLGIRHDSISTLTGMRERDYVCWCKFGSESLQASAHEPICNEARAALGFRPLLTDAKRGDA